MLRRIDEELEVDSDEYQDAIDEFYENLVSEIQSFNPGLS